MAKFFRPIYTNYQTQGFHDNNACVAALNGRPVRPTRVLVGKYPNTCPVDSVKFYESMGMRAHGALDLACYYSEPVYFSGDFPAWMKTEHDMDGGIGVDCVSKEPIRVCTEGCPAGTKHYIKARYWHLKQVIGHDKREVVMGVQIGEGDSTGASSGNHVHYALKWCNADGAGIHTNNGYFGTFDFTPEYENRFVLDELNRRVKITTPPPVAPELLLKQKLSILQQILSLLLQIQNLLKGR